MLLKVTPSQWCFCAYFKLLRSIKWCMHIMWHCPALLAICGDCPLPKLVKPESILPWTVCSFNTCYSLPGIQLLVKFFSNRLGNTQVKRLSQWTIIFLYLLAKCALIKFNWGGENLSSTFPYCVLWGSGSLQTKIQFVRQQLNQSTSTLFLHVK